MVRSLGLFSEFGVSQELESELKLPARLLISLICFRRLARSPSQGDLSPMSESIGRSLAGSLETRSTSFPAPDKFSGEKSWSRFPPDQRSAVLGVVRIGVVSMSSHPFVRLLVSPFPDPVAREELR